MHVTDRFFHHNLTGPEAEQRMLSINSLEGTFLVRQSERQADCFVLTIVVLKGKVKVLHVYITLRVRFHFKNNIFIFYSSVHGLHNTEIAYDFNIKLKIKLN